MKKQSKTKGNSQLTITTCKRNPKMNNNNSQNQYQHFQDISSNNSINHYDNQNNSQVGSTINQQNNNNYFKYQNPQQQVEENPLNDQQNYVAVAVVNANPNLINNQNQNPEIIYCAQKSTTKRRGIYFIEPTTLTNALEQIYSELNLVIPNLNLLGQFNFTSVYQMEEKVIQPIISSNRNLSNEVIRNGKLVYCCQTLQQRVKKYFYYTLAFVSIVTALLTIGYPIYITKYDVSSIDVTLFAVHILVHYIQIITFIISVTKTYYKLLELNALFAILIFLYGILVFVLSLVKNINTSQNNNIGLLLAIQVVSQVIFQISFIPKTGLVSNMRRFLVLVKQLDQTEFLTGSN